MDRVFRGKVSERCIVELKDLVDLFHLLLRSGVAYSALPQPRLFPSLSTYPRGSVKGNSV